MIEEILDRYKINLKEVNFIIKRGEKILVDWSPHPQEEGRAVLIFHLKEE